MNKLLVSALVASMPLLASAQTAIDAYQMSRYDLRGTARSMSMGGAFGALGGDLSVLNGNPGGIGVYRKSEIGVTMDIEMQNSLAKSQGFSNKESQTKVTMPNIGYIGSAYTGSDIMPIFNWGFSYGRTASFNRRYRGTVDMNGSLSNYIAGYTTQEQWTGNDLVSSDANYWDRNHAPWMSILAYNSYMINPVSGTNNFKGLWQNGTTFGVSDFDVEEKGFVDEYNIDLGGNFSDVVYWGIGVGITDIEYQRNVYYEEYLDGACIPVYDTNNQVVAGSPTVTGQDVGFGLDSYKRITGTGVNVKAGVIVRPVNEFRIGLAFHTPTWYNLTESSFADVDYGYGYTTGQLKPDYTGSPIESYDWKLKTPWRMIASAAAVIGSNAIVSFDYEYRPYQQMETKFDDGEKCTDVNGDIKNYYKAANIIRLGAEYRVNNHISLRAGYAYESSPTGSEVKNGDMMVYTSNPYDTGTMPSYTLDNSTQYITCGLGYRYKSFYADAAYVHKSRKSEFHPYTTNDYTADPMTAEIKDNYNNIVLSIGFKF